MTAEQLEKKINEICSNYKKIVMKDVKSMDNLIELLSNFNFTIEKILRLVSCV